MALPATETFTDTNGTALATHNASWTVNSGSFVVQDNGCCPTGSGVENLARWNADTFNNDQYSQCVAAILATGGVQAGVAVRVSTSGAETAYGCYWDNTTAYIFKNVAGTWEQLGATVTPPTAGQLVRLEVSGTTLTLKYDGSTQTTRTDSAISSGAAGLAGYSSGGSGYLDDWEGGNLSAGGGTPPSSRLSLLGVG
jgi:hypothetical protein